VRRARQKRQRPFELNRSHNFLFARHHLVASASERVAATSLARPATGLRMACGQESGGRRSIAGSRSCRSAAIITSPYAKETSAGGIAAQWAGIGWRGRRLALSGRPPADALGEPRSRTDVRVLRGKAAARVSAQHALGIMHAAAGIISTARSSGAASVGQRGTRPSLLRWR
jgi:hypothetical protein